MNTNATKLLRKLEPAVRPTAAGAARNFAPRAPIDALDFDSLLSLVAHGDYSSGRRVQCDCELSDPLDDEQLERLAIAGDMADAAGAQRAVMVIDGRAMIMNVAARVIDTEISAPGSAKVFSEIDAAINVPRADDGPVEILLPFPGGGVIPGPVARQMERALLFGDRTELNAAAQASTAPLEENES